jgi:Siphovirus Gp157
MSTLRLYEIAETYLRALEDLADIEDLPEQAIADTLEGLQGEFEVKAITWPATYATSRRRPRPSSKRARAWSGGSAR